MKKKQNIPKQHTIGKEISIEGTGLHTGEKSKLTFLPATDDTGIIFVRTDLEGDPEVPALIDFIKEDSSKDSLRGTNIEKDGAVIHTVEHVMAALAGLKIDNCYIKISASEPPIMDGSAIDFVNLLKEAGIVEQKHDRKFVEIHEQVSFTNEKTNSQIEVLSASDFRMTVMVDFLAPLGSMHTGMFNIDEFETEFASARTFCYLHEIKYLHSQGLIKGGNLDSALCMVNESVEQKELDEIKAILDIKEDVFIGENGIINNVEMRYPNEPCRHKALDLIGDLYLVGAPIRGQVLAARPGHQSNIEIAKKIREVYKNQLIQEKYKSEKKDVIFDINAIKRILPHRYPFLLVDKITEFEVGKRIVGVKNVTANEELFNGHFPDKPVFPGVLICEAMAQCGGIMFLNMMENPEEKLVYFMSMTNVKFRKPVGPGDQLVMEVVMLRQRRQNCSIKGTAYVDGEVVCEGEFMAAIVDKEAE